MRTTCFRAGVSNSEDRKCARRFISLLAAFIAGVSTGEEFSSGLSRIHHIDDWKLDYIES